MTQEIATQPGAEITEADAAQLAESALAGIDSKDLVLPLLNVAQQQSKVVVAGDIDSGDFFNTITGESFGDSTELVVVHYFKGRFYSDDDDRTFVAAGEIAPANWPEEFAGKAFADIPEAEETWAARANDPDDTFEWGRGPKIDTTHNYVGYIPGEGTDGSPVRLSLRRSSIPAHRKIATLLRFGGAPWNVSIALATELRTEPKPHYIVKATKGRQTDAEERQRAVSLAQQVQSASVRFAGDEAANDRKASREAADAANPGGLDV